MVKVAVLVSGGGTNLQAILDAAAAGALPHAQIALVVSSRPGVAALGRAAKADVPAQVVCRKEYPDSASFDAALLEVLRAHDIRVVVLALSLIHIYRSSPSFISENCPGIRVISRETGWKTL